MVFRAKTASLSVGLIIGLWLMVAKGVHAEVVINEIMFHPGHELPVPENRALEWIELHNTDPLAGVDISGWAFDKGISFTFPAGTVVAAGGFVIVSPSTADFLAAYPAVTAPVLGDWDGRLSNSGEKVRLIDGSGAEVDEIRYSDEGDWARKVDDDDGVGRHWESAAAGGGSSLERLKATATGYYGGNWLPSSAVGGTPGASNDSAVADLPPIITDVKHSPAVPRSGEAVTVTARVIDDSGTAPEVRLAPFVNIEESESPVLELITESTPTRYHVPASGVLGTTWRDVAFNDVAWTIAPQGIGYDSGQDYVPHIGYDSRVAMLSRNASAYCRTRFLVEDPTLLENLTLRIRIDDGFTAFINSQPVGNFNSPHVDALSWNSSAPGNNPDNSAITLTAFDLSDHRHLLVAGENLLAVHALNTSTSSADFLCSYRLEAIPTITSPAPEPMFDDGLHGDGAANDGVYGAIVPGHEAGTIVSFKVLASDSAEQTRVWPIAQSAVYQHDDYESEDGLPVYRLIMEPDDHQAHLSLFIESNSLIDSTLIVGQDVRYTSAVRFRGNSSRRNSPTPLRVELPNDAPLNGTSKLNLNSLAPELQALGLRCFAAAGLPTPEAIPVRVLTNGLDRTNDPSNFTRYDGYVHIEPYGDDFIDRTFPPQDRGGNMYKAQGSHSNNWRYRGTEWTDYASNGWEKRNNSSANDWADLIDFHLKVNTPLDDPAFVDTIENLWDVDQWLRWFAANVVTNNVEGGLPTGSDDDYTLYKRPSDGRWIILPHDFDSMFGQGQSAGSGPANDIVFDMMLRARQILTHPAFRDRYLAHLGELIETTYSAESFNPLVDSLLPHLSGDDRNDLKDWMAARREALRQLLYGAPFVSVENDPTDDFVTLRGTVPYSAATVTINGNSAAIDPWTGEWTMTFLRTPEIQIVAPDAPWRYLDDGSNAGNSWLQPDFDDSSWATGAAPLGYGTSQALGTEIDSGGSFGFGQHVTTYFRHRFFVDDPSLNKGATLTVSRDDGIAVYLNGIEIARDNLDLIADYLTPAGSEIEDDFDVAFSVPVSLLRSGENVLAIELHASDPDFSPDVFLQSSLNLHPIDPGELTAIAGENHFEVEPWTATGEPLGKLNVSVSVDGPPTAIEPPSTDFMLTRATGPHYIAGDLIIPQGVTLTIEPGTTLVFEKDASLVVRGTLLALGTNYLPIHFVPDRSKATEPDIHPDLPRTLPKWDGIRFENSSGNVIAHAIVEGAQDNGGSIGLTASEALLQAIEFSGSHLRYVYTAQSSVVIEDCIFPDMFAENERPSLLGLDNISEHIKGTGQIPAGGHYIIRNNRFGTNKGHNDVVDVDSNTRPAPILQVIGNTFAGAGDECLDLGGDVYVSGNVFQNVAKDPDNTDRGYANAISTGDGATGSTIVVTRNLFLNVDHAINLKRGDRTVFENNTIVGINPDFTDTSGAPVINSAINLFVDEPGASRGSGGYASDNLFVDTIRAFGNADLPGGASSELGFHHNLITAAIDTEEIADRGLSASALGAGNFIGPGDFIDPVNGNFAPHPLGAATGAGSSGQDIGAMIEDRIYITGEPDTITPNSSATLTFGGPGMVAFRYRLDGGAWSADINLPSGFDDLSEPRTVSVELTGLSVGSHQVEAIGQDFAGNWQPEANATLSLQWSVDAAAPAVILSEIFAYGDASNSDFVEILNRSTSSVDVSGWQLSDTDAITPFIFPAGTTLSAGDRLVIFADDLAPGPGWHAPFRLSPEGELLTLSNAAGQPIDSADSAGGLPGYSFSRESLRDDWALSALSPAAEAILIPTAAPTDARISEWLNDPEVTMDEDFIELYNPGSLPVQLGGSTLTQLSTPPVVHTFPENTYIPPNGYLVLWATGATEPLRHELPFKLALRGEAVQIADAQGRGIDHVFLRGSRTDNSVAVHPDASLGFQSSLYPSPGALNAFSFDFIPQPAEEVVPVDALWHYREENSPPPSDWMQPGFDDSSWQVGAAELGFGDRPADEATLVTKGSPTHYFRHQFTAPNDGLDSFLSLRLIYDDGAVIYLNGEEVARVNMPDPPTVIEHATLATGGAENTIWEEDLTSVSVPPGTNTLAVEIHQSSPGSSDMSFSLQASRIPLGAPTLEEQRGIESAAVFESLRISEVMYHPPGAAAAEYIELHNTSLTTPLQLEGVRLRNAIEFDFPDLALPPGGRVLVVEHLTAFEATYGTGLPVIGQYTGKLANGDETIQLYLREPWETRILDFQYEDHWLPSTDGGGLALEIIDSSLPPVTWRNSQSWRAGFSPGTAPLSFSNWSAANGNIAPDADPDSNGFSALAEYALDLGTNSISPLSADPGGFSVLLPTIARPDVTYTLETSADLITWAPINEKVGDSAWSGAPPTTFGTVPPDKIRYTFDANGNAFIRLRLQLAP